MFDTNAMQNLSLGDAAPAQAPPSDTGRGGGGGGGAAQLLELFPAYDAGVLEAVLASCDGNVESAIAQLLDMGPGTTPRAQTNDPQSQIDTDEEVAMALFRQFAEELEEEVPDDVRADPQQYEAYAQERYEQFVAQQSQPYVLGADGAGGSSGSAPSSSVYQKLSGFKMSSMLPSLSKKKGSMQFTSIEGAQ